MIIMLNNKPGINNEIAAKTPNAKAVKAQP